MPGERNEARSMANGVDRAGRGREVVEVRVGVGRGFWEGWRNSRVRVIDWLGLSGLASVMTGFVETALEAL